MVRPKGFDPSVALDRAVVAFWSSGFAATSTSDLMRVMGVGKRSLYDEYGNKRALYGRALERYIDLSDQRHRAVVAGLAPGGPALRALFEAVLDLGPETPTGCFAVNAATETAPGDAGVAGMLDAYFGRSQELLRSLILPTSNGDDADALAGLLHLAWTGYRVQLRTGLTAAEQRSTVDRLLSLVA